MCCVYVWSFFFFKQKTAYEMRISDWSSDVCSSDLQCHGVNRNGRGINSRDMSVQPRDHSDAKGMGGIPDQELFDAIKKGGLAVNKSVLMPAWGGVMSDDEIHDLVAYLRHVCNCGSD